jgi:hypothetical protein
MSAGPWWSEGWGCMKVKIVNAFDKITKTKMFSVGKG